MPCNHFGVARYKVLRWYNFLRKNNLTFVKKYDIIYIERKRKEIKIMAISNKMANEQLREGYLNALTAYLEKEEQVLRVKSNEIAVPVVDANGDEKFVVVTVKVPTGADKGREPYDGYAEAEDYAHKLREKAIKAEKKKAEKEKKIAHDEKMRAKNK